MDPFSLQPKASNLPRTPPTSPQLEAPALLGTPQASRQLIIQGTPLEPEKLLSPTPVVKNEVSMYIYLCYLHLINHPQFGKLFFSGSGCSATKLFFHRGQFNCRKGRRGIFKPSSVRGKPSKAKRNPFFAAKRHPGPS
jgi:hypothetical protein